jgi:hypothetical protein
MVCADRVIAFEAAVLRGGFHPHDNCRLASDRPDLPDQHRRREQPALILEARTEVGDLHAAALCVVEPSYEDWRVLEIMLLPPGDAHQLGAERSAVVGPLLSVEE